MESVQIKAYAKINLSLDVLSKRPDGYHNVRMIMQSIGLFDTLTVQKADKPGIFITSDCAVLPNDDGNLIYRAASLFCRTQAIEPQVTIHLNKNIPLAAGMAGGSSDAAATLKALNQLLQTGLSLSELQAIGVKIGADVPYCLMLGSALSEGIGELLTPLPAAPQCHCLIVKPPVSVSTAYVYSHLPIDGLTHPDIDAQLAAIQSHSFSGVCSTLGNVLETVTIPLHPEIREIKQQMLRLGANGALMSGSGPTVFGLFADADTARAAYAAFQDNTGRSFCWLTEFHDR